MIIRKANKSDVPFIVDAIITIEKTENSNTFNNLFGTEEETTRYYLEQFLLDEENFDTEFSLNTYSIVEIDGERAGCCCLFFTDPEYYQNKSEIFPIHLKKEHLEKFAQNVKTLPDTKQYLTNKFFLEYIFVDNKFRGKGVYKIMINHFFEKADTIYITVLENNLFAIEAYKKIGFSENEIAAFPIDNLDSKFYPAGKKIMLYKKMTNS